MAPDKTLVPDVDGTVATLDPEPDPVTLAPLDPVTEVPAFEIDPEPVDPPVVATPVAVFVEAVPPVAEPPVVEYEANASLKTHKASVHDAAAEPETDEAVTLPVFVFKPETELESDGAVPLAPAVTVPLDTERDPDPPPVAELAPGFETVALMDADELVPPEPVADILELDGIASQELKREADPELEKVLLPEEEALLVLENVIKVEPALQAGVLVEDNRVVKVEPGDAVAAIEEDPLVEAGVLAGAAVDAGHEKIASSRSCWALLI